MRNAEDIEIPSISTFGTVNRFLLRNAENIAKLSSCFNGTYDDSKTNNTGGNDPLCYSFLKIVYGTEHLVLVLAGMMYGMHGMVLWGGGLPFFLEFGTSQSVPWAQPRTNEPLQRKETQTK